MELERARRKTSDHVTTPPGTSNTIQGQAVLGYCHGDAAAHPVLTYVVR
jgi:hypothetical protein